MRRRNDLRSFHSAQGKKVVLHNPRSNKREIVSEKELFSPSSHFTEGGALWCPYEPDFRRNRKNLKELKEHRSFFTSFRGDIRLVSELRFLRKAHSFVELCALHIIQCHNMYNPRALACCLRRVKGALHSIPFPFTSKGKLSLWNFIPLWMHKLCRPVSQRPNYIAACNSIAGIDH